MTNQKALARKSTLTNTETQDNQFEGRGFTVQKKSDTHTPKSDLNTLLLQAKTFGHSISKLAGQESSSASPQTNGLSIQPKLSIGEPGDRYEQEADRVASVVVQRINAPSSTGESVQREAMPEEEDELQMKPLADSIQRQEDDEEELQMKSLADSIQRVEIDDEEELQMKSQVQRREAIGGGEASTDLESSINSARVGGQAIADNIREPMEVAFGTDFSGVKVHTDGQSDQLNRSIQARAFTTGQDVFFRQGEYNPGSRGGQELLAHELTHVVQQNRGAVQRSRVNSPQHLSETAPSISDLQRSPLSIQLVAEYDHMVIDKLDVGLDALRNSLNANGLQTAQNRNIKLSEGSEKLGHHQHVFMWDKSKKGIEGSVGIEQRGGTVRVKIRKNGLTEPKWYSQGNLKGDNMGPLGGTSTTGAWAYEGDIERKYLFIEGLDQVNQPGFDNWYKGDGWPEA